MKWFQKAVSGKLTLRGWAKSQSASVRRAKALSSRPKSLPLKKRWLSVSRALTALANVTQDKATKTIAKQDAEYFMELYKKSK